MTLTEGLAWRSKGRSITSTGKKAGDKENLVTPEAPRIKASLKAHPTPRGRNFRFVIKLETIPEISNLEIAQPSKLSSIKPAKDATESMDYSIQPANASSVKPKNEEVKGDAGHFFQPSEISSVKNKNVDTSEDIDDSLQDLSWILLMPGLFPLDSKETEHSSPLRLDELVPTSPHAPVEQPTIGPPVSWGLPSREEPPTPRPPGTFLHQDIKTINRPTASNSERLLRSGVLPLQESPAWPSPSLRSQVSLGKDTGKNTIELLQQRPMVESGLNVDEPFTPPPRPSRAPPVPPEPNKRQSDPVASPPPRPSLPLPVPPEPNKEQSGLVAGPPPKPSRPPPIPPEPNKRQDVPAANPSPSPPQPPSKPLERDKRPSIQIESPTLRPSRHPNIPSKLSKRQLDSRSSKRPTTQKLFREGKKLFNDVLRKSRSSVRTDSAHSFAQSQIGAHYTQTDPEPTNTATQVPPLSPSQSNPSSSSSDEKSSDKGRESTPASRNIESRTNSTAPSIASKAGAWVSKATSLRSKLKFPRALSRKGSEAFPNSFAIEQKYCLPKLDFCSRTLLPFQCTMCFVQLNNKTEWIQHEQCHNYASYNDDDDDEIGEWYWRCGICDTILHSWNDRQNHIADEHFESEQTLSDWNSSTSPYPWGKLSSKPVPGYPPWDISTLRSMQPTILDDFYREAEPRNACGVCDLAFPASSELDQHMKQNHVSWSCPTTTRKRKATFLFEMCRDGCKNQFHSCRCCHMSFCDDSADWKQRKEHFEQEHRFIKCDHDQFFEHAQFCHHLASSHHVEIDFLDITDQCRTKEYASS